MGDGRLNGQTHKRSNVRMALHPYGWTFLLPALLRKDPPYAKDPQVVKFWEQKKGSQPATPFASQRIFITDRSDQPILLLWRSP